MASMTRQQRCEIDNDLTFDAIGHRFENAAGTIIEITGRDYSVSSGWRVSGYVISGPRPRTTDNVRVYKESFSIDPQYMEPRRETGKVRIALPGKDLRTKWTRTEPPAIALGALDDALHGQSVLAAQMRRAERPTFSD